MQHSKRNLTPKRKRLRTYQYSFEPSSCRYLDTTPMFANARNVVQNDKLQNALDAQIKEIKDVCIAIGGKDADIAALKEKLSSLLQDTNLQIKTVRKPVRD